GFPRDERGSRGAKPERGVANEDDLSVWSARRGGPTRDRARGQADRREQQKHRSRDGLPSDQRSPDAKMVEAEGIEPSSESRSRRSPTRVVRYPSSRSRTPTDWVTESLA